ncbi:hypothetical protein GUITHDRAFT_109937 [Guillardia theta CCMP2712]|uniref:Uncharacterized protein n=1 Tax=Guillardia theta (strain CCMP2712) TaxID=905079 RepID=L1J729_GUITC|nr:hypothetical protein GUITHDRAFT_109937 [Guillardia theta CCMP2712]EKX44152.1 hypothetical protein GUITHDRAFT_109937 [Guillardia theta CCMP2712]|eukprot:XP_005831132.1 hypothetical protein GUITHDRAFT_109937 [Guillardia theta CCMP2712]
MAMQVHVQVEKVGGQGNSITIGVAPERRELYTTADDKLIKVWSLEDGKCKSCINAHKGRITCLVWLNHVRMMLSTSLDQTVALWNAKGECVVRSKFPCAIYCAGYSSRHDIVVLGGMKKMFVLQLLHQRDEWELNTQSVFEEHDEFISEIICTPSGRIFSCGYDGVVCAFDLNVEDKLVVMTAGGNRAKSKCHKGAITCAAYYNEGNSLITGSYDMSVKTWSYDALTAHAQFSPLYTIELKKTVETMCCIPATKSLWVGIKGSCRPFVFDPRTGTNLTDFLPQSEDFKSLHNEYPVKIMASASEVVTMSDHKNFTIWRYNSLACISIIHGHTDWVELVVRNPRTGDFVSSGADSIIRKWYIPNALYPQLYSMKEGPDTSILFTGGDDAMTLEGHTGKITAMCLLAHFLISVSVDKSVKIWDSNTGTLWRTIEDAHESMIYDVSSSERMDTFATCSADELCYIWELETCELCGVMKGHEDEVTRIRWIDELDAWLTASDDNSLRLWQASGHPYSLSESSIRSQSEHSAEEPIMMRFDTDGFSALEVIGELGLQAVGLSDYSVQLIDIIRESILCVYKGHYDVVRSIAFLPVFLLLPRGRRSEAGWE